MQNFGIFTGVLTAPWLHQGLRSALNIQLQQMRQTSAMLLPSYPTKYLHGGEMTQSPALPVLTWIIRTSPGGYQGKHSNPAGTDTPREELLPPAPQFIYLTTRISSLVNISGGDRNSGYKAQDLFLHSFELAPMQIFVHMVISNHCFKD